MKKDNIKSVSLFIFEIVLIIGTGVLLCVLKLDVFINLFIYILLALEIILTFIYTNKLENTNAKAMMITSFVMVGVACQIYMFVKTFKIPSVLVTAYAMLQGFLIMTGAINVAKLNEKNAKVARIIGCVLYALLMLIAILGLFGIAY